jgi:prevent-host-death family protein
MERIGIRELRNDVSRVVRRARSGEQIVITINGAPAAQLGPLNDGASTASVDDLVAAGLIRGPRATTEPRPARPVKAPSGTSTSEILADHRNR